MENFIRFFFFILGISGYVLGTRLVGEDIWQGWKTYLPGFALAVAGMAIFGPF